MGLSLVKNDFMHINCISLSLSICIYCRCIYALFLSLKRLVFTKVMIQNMDTYIHAAVFFSKHQGGKPEGPFRKTLELARLCGVERSRTDLHAMYGEATYSHSNVYAPPRKYTS